MRGQLRRAVLQANPNANAQDVQNYLKKASPQELKQLLDKKLQKSEVAITTNTAQKLQEWKDSYTGTIDYIDKHGGKWIITN